MQCLQVRNYYKYGSYAYQVLSHVSFAVGIVHIEEIESCKMNRSKKCIFAAFYPSHWWVFFTYISVFPLMFCFCSIHIHSDELFSDDEMGNKRQKLHKNEYNRRNATPLHTRYGINICTTYNYYMQINLIQKVT